MKAVSTIARRAGRLVFGVGVMAGGVMLAAVSAQAQSAATIDYVGLFRTQVLPCLHPTVKPETATIEAKDAPKTAGDTTTVRIEAFYKGLIKKDTIEANLMVRQSGTIRQLKVDVLSDSSALHGSCDLTKNWKDF